MISEIPMPIAMPYTKSESHTSQRSMRSSCRICLSTILEPAALTCGHKFCESCLDQYWNEKDRPNFIVCPLCRSCVSNVDFSEKDAAMTLRTKEFRQAFGDIIETPEPESDKFSLRTTLCLKFVMIIPILYCLLKLLKPTISDLVSLLRVRFRNRI